jgi:uncharacterized repeat protein (TIGR02543 family)
MGKKQIWTILLFAVALCVLLGGLIAANMGTFGNALPANAYEEEWDVVMEIADLSSEEQPESDLTETAAYPSELKIQLDKQSSISNVVVAIIDTGLDYEEFDQKDRVIDIREGTVDIAMRSALAGPFKDENGHGTAMAEIIAKNSGESVKLLPIRVTDAEGKTTVAKVCQAIELAVENDADIINISMNTLNSTTSRLLEVTIDQAVERGIPVVVSAGNKNVDTKNISPANVESATVISAVDQNGNFAAYSNYGDTVDYSAPGCYGGKSGTSYAAAYYSGVLAEAFSKGWSAEVLDSYLYDGGATGWDRLYGNGIVTFNAFSEQELLQSLFGEDGWEEFSDSAILKMEDFHNLSDEKIDNYIEQSDLADVGYYLKSLSSDDRKELLGRNTILTQKVSFCQGAFSGEDILGEESLALTEKEECLYFEKCLAEYEKESELMHISATGTYFHKTGFFYLAFVDETGSGLSTTYKICARVCLASKSLTGEDLESGKADNRSVTSTGNNSNAITVWSAVCTGGSDTMSLQWIKSGGEYASFRTDDSEFRGRIFVPNITVLCPAYTLMYKDDPVHAASGSNCNGRANFFEYTAANSLTYSSNKGRYNLRKYGMQTTATRQELTPQINTSHMNLSDTSRIFTAEDTHCTLYVRLNSPETTLTVDPNGEKWGGTENTSSLQVINAQSYDLGKTTATNYRAVFYGAGDANDPAGDTTVTTTKAFSYWSLTYAANGKGQNGTQHSYMSGTTFVAGTVEYDKNSTTSATTGELATATAVFSGSTTITFPSAPARTGYSFAGWYTGAQKGSGTLACSSQNAGRATITLTSDQSFHAEWTKNRYTVSFYNGDEYLTSESYLYRSDIDLSVSEQKEDGNGYYYEQKISSSKSVQVRKNEYVLVGWSLSQEGMVVAKVNVPANHGTKLYAVWSRPTSGMKQVVVTLQSGENRGTSVIATTGTATVNLTLGLRAYFYQAQVPLLVTADGVAITADGYSYAEDNAGNKTPLAGSAIDAKLPVRYTFLYKFYRYNAVTKSWDYIENNDNWEMADVYVGEDYTYNFCQERFCAAPDGYTYDHAEYNGEEVELPYTVGVTGAEDDETVRTLDVFFYPVTCKLTFDANGGTFPADGLGELFAVSADGTLAEREVLFGSVIGTFPGVQKGQFYSCTGFYDTRDGGNAFDVNDTVCGNLVLYAGWETKSGMVRYDAESNGGTIDGNACLDTLVLYESEIPYGEYTAVRDKYEFLGWSLAAQSMPEEKQVKVLCPSKDTVLLQTDALTLYAQFSRTLNVQFHQWNYVENAYRKDKSLPVLYNNESSVEVITPRIQSYENWEIYGWSAATEAAETYDIGEETEVWVNDDLDYYALYRREVTIIYDTGIAPDENEISFDGTDTGTAYRGTGGGEDLPAEFVIREGPNQPYYTFLYWEGSDGEAYNPGDTYASTEDLSLTAVWEADRATVIYDAQMNGGTVNGKDCEVVEIAYGSEIPADRDTFSAVKESYEFLGWNTDPDAREGLPVNPDMDAKTIDDGVLTLYAIYKRQLCSSFYQQGEKEAQRVIGYLYNNDDRVTVHAPALAEYAGWTPLGWTSGTTATSNVELCSDSDFELMDDCSFYALYEKEVTLTYNSGVKSIDIPSISGYTYHNTYESTASLDEPAHFTAAGMIEQEKRSFLNWENEDGVYYRAGEEILLYDDMLLSADWDEYPRILALDRYFTLEQATASGQTYINRSVLLDPEYVTASDAEDEDDSLKISLTGYYAEDFASLAGSADLMVYFQVTDSYGHTATTAATIHVVDAEAEENPVAKETRFLSPEYYMSGEEYVEEEDGGLSSTSLWRMDEELAVCLSGAMENVREAGTGNVRYYSYYTMEDVRGVKKLLLEEAGFGKYASRSTLSDFIETYIKKDSE